MKLNIELSNEEIPKAAVSVIIECWKKQGYGRGRREYFKLFTEDERDKIKSLLPIFHKWCLSWNKGGFPQSTEVFKTISDIELVKKAGNFFATI